MNDDCGKVSIYVTDFQKNRSPIRSDHHRQAVAEIPDAYRIAICMQNLVTCEAMCEGRRGDDRVVLHNSKITCRGR